MQMMDQWVILNLTAPILARRLPLQLGKTQLWSKLSLNWLRRRLREQFQSMSTVTALTSSTRPYATSKKIRKRIRGGRVRWKSAAFATWVHNCKLKSYFNNSQPTLVNKTSSNAQPMKDLQCTRRVWLCYLELVGIEMELRVRWWIGRPSLVNRDPVGITPWLRWLIKEVALWSICLRLIARDTSLPWTQLSCPS